MCLDVVYSPAEMGDWLKDKPETITAYKVVRKINGTYYPSCVRIDDKFFPRRMNRIKGYREVIGGNFKGCYEPFYHLFIHEEDAVSWGRKGINAALVVCKVPKKDIKAVGKQDHCMAIVTRAFKIVEESIVELALCL